MQSSAIFRNIFSSDFLLPFHPALENNPSHPPIDRGHPQRLFFALAVAALGQSIFLVSSPTTDGQMREGKCKTLT